MSSRLYRTQGVALRAFKLGEADRIVSFLTPDRGKVRAVAKGIRKTKSKFGGRLEPVNHVSLQCYEGRELDIVTQVETINAFRGIHEDFGRLTKALAMLEVVDVMSQEGEYNPGLFRALVGALNELDDRDSPVLVGAFYWRLLSLDGVHPVLDACVGCGASEDLRYFDLHTGGVSCLSCRRGALRSSRTIALLRRALGGDLVRVLRETEGEQALEFETMADEAMEYHLERRLRTKRILHV